MELNIEVIKRFIEDVNEEMGLSAEGEAADAGFDAGEFSGPAHARLLERRLHEIATGYGAGFVGIIDAAERVGVLDGYDAHCFRMMVEE